MRVLDQCAPSRWADFLSIRKDDVPNGSGEDVDLFVGANKSVEITLKEGTTLKFRDVVVFGELVLKSSDPQNALGQPEMVVRDVLIPGKINLDNINLQSRNVFIAKNAEAFRSELHELFVDWMAIQRESVNRIGLRSILDLL